MVTWDEFISFEWFTIWWNKLSIIETVGLITAVIFCISILCVCCCLCCVGCRKLRQPSAKMMRTAPIQVEEARWKNVENFLVRNMETTKNRGVSALSAIRTHDVGSLAIARALSVGVGSPHSWSRLENSREITTVSHTVPVAVMESMPRTEPAYLSTAPVEPLLLTTETIVKTEVKDQSTQVQAVRVSKKSSKKERKVVPQFQSTAEPPTEPLRPARARLSREIYVGSGGLDNILIPRPDFIQRNTAFVDSYNNVLDTQPYHKETAAKRH